MNDKKLTKMDIKERGWTDWAIKKFLGQADELKNNPVYRCAPKMQLWEIDTVENAEKKDDFIKWKKSIAIKRQKLSEHSKKRHETKKSLLKEWIDSLQIKIPKYEETQLYNIAIENYNNLRNNRGEYEKIIYEKYQKLDKNFLNRITVNAIVYGFSDYDDYLSQIKGMSGASDIRNKLKRKILTAIHQTYPHIDYEGFENLYDNEKPKDEVNSNPVFLAVTNLAKELARIVAKTPNALENIEWRDMERIIAVIFEELGFQVTLTPASKDGGKDVIVEYEFNRQQYSYIIEIKHWPSNQKVGKDYVSDFISVITKEHRHGGLYLATYGYAKNISEVYSEVEREKLKLGDKIEIISLCRTFVKSENGIMIPEPSDLKDIYFPTMINK